MILDIVIERIFTPVAVVVPALSVWALVNNSVSFVDTVILIMVSMAIVVGVRIFLALDATSQELGRVMAAIRKRKAESVDDPKRRSTEDLYKLDPTLGSSQSDE